MFDCSFLTIHPQFIQAYFGFGVFKSAKTKNLASFRTINLRDFAVDQRGSVDDRPYGGGDGMILRPEPLAAAIKTLPESAKVILTSPGGEKFDHTWARRISMMSGPVVIVCGRFGGVDQRFVDRYVDYEISLGNYVISGGELAALTMIDAALREIPGVLGHPKSAEMDSFAAGMNGKIEYPQYTRPEVFENISVPPEIISGNHKSILEWRKSLLRHPT